MAAASRQTSPAEGAVWVIGDGRYLADSNAPRPPDIDNGPIKVYEISALGRYLLDPSPIEVNKRLVGCEAHPRPPRTNRYRAAIRRVLPKRLHRFFADRTVPPIVFFSDFAGRKPALETPDLERHFSSVQEQIRIFDSAFQRLSRLDATRLVDVVGICEDPTGTRTGLNLQGSVAEKIDFVIRSIGQPIRVRLTRSHIAEGLFELSGFDFTGFDPTARYQLFKFFKDGKAAACVAEEPQAPAFWVRDVHLIRYLQLLEQSIRTNPNFRESMTRCIQGKAVPMRLMYNHSLEVDYSRAELPRLFREVCDAHNLSRTERDVVKSSLNQMQLGISFHYIARTDGQEDKMVTDISILQEVRALESIRRDLPRLYTEIAKRTAASEIGKYYLLDAIRGYRDDV